MNQRIGNVGVLNLVNATAESIKGIERIENVGMVLYRKENAYLLTSLNIGNIGSSLEVSEGFRFFNGVLNIDNNYLDSITEPVNLLINGMVIIDHNVYPEQLKQGFLNLIVNGKVYCPPHLAGVATLLLAKGSGEIETYHGTLPRTENGKFTLTNSFLDAVEGQLNLVVNGLLSLSKDLEMEKFIEKIGKLEVNGKIMLHEHQEVFLYKKAASLASCKMEIIPDGYEVLTKQLRLNSRSLRRFKNKKLFTNKPIILEADVTREKILEAIAKIHSTSVIICHEEIEDLLYELSSLLDTEILSYENQFVIVEDEEVWSNDQFLALDHPANFIIKGKLVLDMDVSEEVLRNKIAAIDVLGEVVVRERKMKGVLHNVIRLNKGSVEVEGKRDVGSSLQNVGELTL